MKHAYYRELFVLILRQPRHGGVGSGTARLVFDDAFECLSTLTNAVLKGCAAADDYKSALGILEVSGMFYRNSDEGQVFLHKRLEKADLWRKSIFWEWCIEYKIEESSVHMVR